LEEKQHSRKIGQIIETGMKYATYLFLFFVLTGIKKGGDMRLFIPYITVMFLIAHIAVSRDFSVLRMALFNALACYVVLSYVLVLFSFSPRISLTALNRDVLPGMFLFLAIHFRSDAAEKVRELLFVFVAALAVVVAGGYFSYIRRYLEEGSGGHLSPDIPFLKFKLYFNVFAMKVNFLLPFAVACTAMLRTKAARYILWVLIAASAGAVLLSLSRGGWISLLAIFFFFSFFLSRGRLKLSHAIAASSLFLVIFCTVVWLVFPTVRQRILATSSDEIGTVNLRTEIWQHYISAVKEKPYTGWGYGDRIIWDDGPLVLHKESAYEVSEQFRIGTHNTLLFVLYHQGIIGLAFYLILMTVRFMQLVKFPFHNKGSADSGLAFTLLTAFICVYALHSAIETLPFAFPCILFGILSGMQQRVVREQAAVCQR
jgi:O-antigen ligase